MDRIENLCVVAMEECAEIQQAISKSMRFGVNNYRPETVITNSDQILIEYYQLQAVMEMLIREGYIKDFESAIKEEIKKEKEEKVKKYTALSEDLGFVR